MMNARWVGPDNGDGNVVEFGRSRSERQSHYEQTSKEANAACDQLAALSELSAVYISEVCDSLGIDAYPLNRALNALRHESDSLILSLEEHL